MVIANIEIPEKLLANFCRQQHIQEVALFGSILRNDFHSDSDIDVLLTFSPDARPTLFDLVQIQEELRKIFGRKVDVLTRSGIEHSRNRVRRDAILSSAEIIYAAR